MSRNQSRFQRPLMDSRDDEYVLAGRLLGTEWVFPGSGADEIQEIRRSSVREHGERMYYPSVVFAHGSGQFRVKSFISRVDPDDIGDVKPGNQLAVSVVESLA